MGSVSRIWEEQQARGWAAPEKAICPDCVSDDFLKALIQGGAERTRCDYCGKRKRSPFAAPVEVIMPAIASALGYLYADPADAGVPYDGGWLLDLIDTSDALMDIPLECHEGLFEDIVEAFENSAWVPAAYGHWASTHRDKEWSLAWSSFADRVKHRSRHFFVLGAPRSADESLSDPLSVLGLVGQIATEIGLLTAITVGSRLFRVRERIAREDWPISEDQVSAPPSMLARAGRMNPAGISYLYLSRTESGALAETLRGPPCTAAVAEFEVVAPIDVLDLTLLPSAPSVFDEEQRDKREAVLFLESFVWDICQPVAKDGREHVNYVPSQVVSEYFAQVFRAPNGHSIRGIVYPSAVSKGSVNITLFPDESRRPFDHLVRFLSAREVTLNRWDDFSKALGREE